MRYLIGLRALFILVLILIAAGCRQQQLSSSDVKFDVSASDFLVGGTTLLVRVHDKDGNSIEKPGSITVRADMYHAGMLPVFAEAENSHNGVFTLPFEWTMAGGWIVEASLTLESGEIVTRTFDYQILNEASNDSMTSMDHSDMQGESSAIYLQIENRGSADVTILSAFTSAANLVEFHQTIVENDIARMEPVDALVIPAGESLSLRPGGMHIMLQQLTADLIPGTNISLHLRAESGQVFAVEVPIMDMLMNDNSPSIKNGDLVFSRRWARPANAAESGDTDHAGMQNHATERDSG